MLVTKMATEVSVDSLAAMVAESFSVYDKRFERLEAGQHKLEKGFAKLEAGHDTLEKGFVRLVEGQARIEKSLADIKLSLNETHRKSEEASLVKRILAVEKKLKLSPA